MRRRATNCSSAACCPGRSHGSAQVRTSESGKSRPFPSSLSSAGSHLSCRSRCSRARTVSRSKTRSSTSATRTSSWSTSPRLRQADAVHKSAFEFDTGVDEFEALGLEKAPSEVISAPRIAGAPISFECVVNRIIPMPPLPDHVVWGEVKRIHVRDDLYLSRGRIDVGALGAFGRLAGEYTLVNNIFSTPLPDGRAEELSAQRAERLDEHSTDYSPIDTNEWSASGSTKAAVK